MSLIRTGATGMGQPAEITR